MSYMDPRPEGLNTEPAPPSVVETLRTSNHKTVTFDASQYQLVPKVPSSEMLDSAVSFALNVKISGSYNWSAYMGDLWRQMLDAAPTPAAQSAGQEAVAWPILKGVGKIDGDGWKDTTKVGQIVYVWNAELPAPNMEGQFPRIGNEIWSASTKQYDFTPATMEEIRDFFTTHFAPVNGGERETVEQKDDADAFKRVFDIMTRPNAVKAASPAKVGAAEREAFAKAYGVPKPEVGQPGWSEWHVCRSVWIRALEYARAALSADGGEPHKEAQAGPLLCKAATKLPAGWEIVVEVENGYGGVNLIAPDGTETDFSGQGMLLSEQIGAAIDAAIAAKAKGDV
ncbi:hypothetical protein [Pandoraea sp. CB10b_02]|uniref:hypothetical protein n=1 Tax=Pandoraea sp. CB10b_02 TaxID=2014535 RepID=UPI00257D5BEA|nr:hypothetical protein [Pandoraea sp. CB10b_02]